MHNGIIIIKQNCSTLLGCTLGERASSEKLDLSTFQGIKKTTQDCIRFVVLLWSLRTDLNSRPAAYKAAALPAELRRRAELIVPDRYNSVNISAHS